MAWSISDGDVAPGDPASEAARAEVGRAATRVLVVDDDHDVREALVELLRDEGYDVLTARNGAEALAVLRTTTPPDAILLDLMMPVMDGWEFRSHQKNDPVISAIPVIAMSANGTAQARAVDAAEFLPKPVDATVLLSTIERVFSRAQAARLANAERMSALGALAVGVAHEINNPLTYMLTNLDILDRRLREGSIEQNAETTELLADVLHGAQRIARIVRSVQAVTPPRRGERPGAVDVQAAVEASLRVVNNELRHRARVETSFERLPAVRACPGQLEQVFTNLLLNAAHAIPDGHADRNRVAVTTTLAPSGSVIVRVSDSGAGIPEAIRHRIFEPFFTTKDRGTGTGLGLSICHGIVKSLGGALTFVSRPGGGTTFEVVLPPMPSSRAPRRRKPDLGADPTRRIRVLAIDDDEPVLRAIGQLLSPEHDVHLARTGREALDRLQAPALDVVLCGLQLPDVSGLELLEAIEAADPALAARTVFMTGGAFTPSARVIAEAGRHLVLPKPISREALRAALELATADLE